MSNPFKQAFEQGQRVFAVLRAQDGDVHAQLVKGNVQAETEAKKLIDRLAPGDMVQMQDENGDVFMVVRHR